MIQSSNLSAAWRAIALPGGAFLPAFHLGFGLLDVLFDGGPLVNDQETLQACPTDAALATGYLQLLPNDLMWGEDSS